MEKYIKQWIYEEVNEGIVVKKQYPEIQVDEFEYTIPFKEGGRKGFDKIGLMISTIHNNKLHYEYGVLDLNLDKLENKDHLINTLKIKLIENIMKQLTDKEANDLQKEIDHILDSGANSIRILNMIDTFLDRRGCEHSFDIGKSIAIFRICEHCNKEYELILSYSGDRTMAVNNFQICPNCKERDDAWVKLKVKDTEDCECEHPFNRLHWVDNVVFCNKCGKTLHK